MDMTTSIAALSISMHQQQFQQDADILMTKKIMDVQEAQSSAQIEMIQQASVPSTSRLLDTLA